MTFLTCNVAGASPADIPFSIDIDIRRLVIAGWAGRDERDVEHHIRELEALGVARPQKVPFFYEVAASLLTNASQIEVVGSHSSAEVEVVLLQSEHDGVLVGIGSDHTDRRVESYDVTVSKQMCAKPVGGTLWRYCDVESHWDALIARSWLVDGNNLRTRYQEGPISSLRLPADLIGRRFGTDGMPAGMAMFCGTQPVMGPLQGASRYALELFDPVLKRSLRHEYAATQLAHAL
jgi:hypothetical protein